MVDIGTLIAGPFGATLLGDFGAEIIKVEQPGRGDALRGTPINGKAARPLNWMIDARNKKPVTCNLRVEAGQCLMRDLIAHADVLFENFTPGTLEQWGLGWEVLHAINPQLVMVRVSGYGQTGPYRKRPGYDRIALGFSGYMYPTGFPDRYPVRSAFPTVDYNTATFGAFAAMLALYQRDAQGGRGQMIDLALYEAPFRITSDPLATFVQSGKVRERIGNRNPGFSPAGTFETKDGRYVQVAAGGDNVWKRLAHAIERPELATDGRYARSRDRSEHANELEVLLAEWIGAREFIEVERRLVEANVPVGGIYTAEDIAHDAHFAARESAITLDDGDGTPLPMPGVIPKLSHTPGAATVRGPELGQHNDEIYRVLLGKSETELSVLYADGVI